jgi:tRNA dimethylallyltransferase
MNKKPLVILTGPTAVGKTELSIGLAKAIDGEIISADSMQVYRYMDVGTAKVNKEEMQGVPHHLIDYKMPDEEFNVVVWKNDAKKVMKDIYDRGRIPIIVGGTGFYIQALLYDIDFTKESGDKAFRESMQNIAAEKGAQAVHDMLLKVDPESAKTIHANNVKRVIRALEYYHDTGKPISKHNEEERQKESPYQFAYFVLNRERQELYRRIDYRIDKMMEQGLLDEVMNLRGMGYSKELVSMQGLGYKEMFPYLDGECSLEDAIYILKRDTRHFAKRQLTWFRREKQVQMIQYENFHDTKEVLNFICKELKDEYNIG